VTERTPVHGENEAEASPFLHPARLTAQGTRRYPKVIYHVTVTANIYVNREEGWKVKPSNSRVMWRGWKHGLLSVVSVYSLLLISPLLQPWISFAFTEAYDGHRASTVQVTSRELISVKHVLIVFCLVVMFLKSSIPWEFAAEICISRISNRLMLVKAPYFKDYWMVSTWQFHHKEGLHVL
jgi:hypothetical protein